MDILVVFAIIWFVGRLIKAIGKNSSSSDKQRQAVEEQRRRRESYEAAQDEQARHAQTKPAQRSWQEILQTEQEALPETLREILLPGLEVFLPEQAKPIPAERHHIDDVEEERCETAQQEKQFQREQKRQQRHRPKPAVPAQVSGANTSFQGNALVQGIIMAEILGPPRSKRKQIR